MLPREVLTLALSGHRTAARGRTAKGLASGGSLLGCPARQLHSHPQLTGRLRSEGQPALVRTVGGLLPALSQE